MDKEKLREIAPALRAKARELLRSIRKPGVPPLDDEILSYEGMDVNELADYIELAEAELDRLGEAAKAQEAINTACKELPPWYWIVIRLEEGSGWVEVEGEFVDGYTVDCDGGLVEQIHYALNLIKERVAANAS